MNCLEQGSGSSLSSKEPPIQFIDGLRGRKKVLLCDGHIFYFHSTAKQSTYFKCSQKQKGCNASITVKGFNKNNCSFESYIVTKREHFNHLPNLEDVVNQEEDKEKERLESEPNSDNKQVCLFCLKMLPPGYLEVTSIENVLPSGEILTLSLTDPLKNSQAFDLLCSLLNVRWMEARKGQYFDQRNCLPLCFNCQNLHQELYQLHQQIRMLEVLLNKNAKLIREKIGESEKARKTKGLEQTQLQSLGLELFRRQVVDPGLNRLKSDDLMSSRAKKTVHRQSKIKNTVVTNLPSEDSNLSVLVKDEALEVDQVLNDLIDPMEPSWCTEDDDDNDSHSKTETETKELASDRRRSSRPVKKRKVYTPPNSSGEENCSDDNDNYSSDESLEDLDAGGDSDLEVKTSSVTVRGTTKPSSSSSSSNRYQKRRSHSSRHQPTKIQTCNICSTRVVGSRKLWNHYKAAHPGYRRYSCKYCKKHYIRMRDVIVHQRTHTGEKPYKCVSCPLSFASGSRLRLHILSSHTKSDFPCSQCDKTFPSKTSLTNHLIAVHGETPKSQVYKKSKKPIKTMTCHLCDASIPGGGGPFLQHYKDLHPEEKRFSCKFCHRHFPYIRRVLVHQRTHTGEKPFPCDDCEKSFINAAALRYHRNTKHVDDQEKKFGCSLCPKRFAWKACLTSHMDTHKERLIICKTCGKTFKLGKSFKRHNEANHHGMAEYTAVTNPSQESLESLDVPGIQFRKKCHICLIPIPGKVFLQNHFKECHPDHPGDVKTCRCGHRFKTYKEVYTHALRKHMTELEKPFQCDKCAYSCLTTTELKTHSLIHVPMEERQKLHMCDICGLGCSAPGTLAQHMKKHQAEKSKYVCELCGKSYVERRGLTQHKKTNHFKILPHKCPFEGCGKAFPLKSILLRHQNVHTGENTYKCEQCNKNFKYTNSLARHKKEQHGADGEGQTPRKRKKREEVKQQSQQETAQSSGGFFGDNSSAILLLMPQSTYSYEGGMKQENN